MERSKKILSFIFIAILAIGVFIFLYSSIIFQEGSPWPQVEGIIQLTFTNKDVVKLSGSDGKYITKNRDGQEPIFNFLKNQGYNLIEQMGSGYLFQSADGDRLTVTRRFYSRFYSIWNISKTDNILKSIKWTDYENKEYHFALRYPDVSVDNYLWGVKLPEGLSTSDVLFPNQILSQDNNFYLHEKYDVSIDQKTGKLVKIENTSVPGTIGPGYPPPWSIVILDVKDENDLDKVIKRKLGEGCSYKDKIPTGFDGSYKVEINGDGKDLGSTLCPVNYVNYIVYSPSQKKIAFWGTGQECQIGIGFSAVNCFDEEISKSFHFIENN